MTQLEVLRILLIEDNAGDGELVREALIESKRSCELRHALDLAPAMEMLDSWSPDIALVDLGLADSQGLETLARVHRRAPELPIVVLTGLNDEKSALAALDEGAQDYLVKGEFTPQLLNRSIRYSLQRQRLATENRRVLAELADAKSLLEQKNQRLAEMYDTAHQFVDDVSHEFRSPLTVVKEYTALLREGLAGSVTVKQGEFLDVISRRIDDLAALVDDLLDMSRIEAGVLGVRRRACRVEDVVSEAWSQLEQKAARKQIVLERNIGIDLPPVYCDPEKVGRVLVNLAVNAVKFTPERGTVSVWAAADEQPGYLRIGVTDSGAGMDSAAVRSVFDRFQQTLVGRRAGIKGFGLGLSIVKELVQLNLGEMSVASNPGSGSTFAFSVPIAAPVSIVAMALKRCAADGLLPQWMSLVVASATAATSESSADEMDFLLNDALRSHDLAFRLGSHQWQLAIRCQDFEVVQLRERLDQLWAESNVNRPHDKLPEIEIRCLGSWKIGEQDGALLSTLQAHLHEATPIGV